MCLIARTSATGGGEVTSDGGSTIGGRGVCWSTSEGPTLADSYTMDGPLVGRFTSSITGLAPNTLYHVRAYAFNDIAVNYGGEVSFRTLQPEPISDIEGNLYHTVAIGTQVWMVENLKTTKYSNGEDIGSTIPASLDITSETSPKYQWVYHIAEDTVAFDGRLYTWFAVADSRNICPTGWHVPTDAEWTTLTSYLGGESVAGGKLKETAFWQSPNVGATNETGFTALPGGTRRADGIFAYPEIGAWWSSSSNTSINAWFRFMYHEDATVDREDYYFSGKSDGFSVRCLKN